MRIDPAVRNRIKRFARAAKWFFTPVALVFLSITVWQSWPLIAETLKNSVPLFFFLAVLAWMAAHLISPLFARIILRGFGQDISYRATLGMHLQYLPARYIPGGVWHTVARVGRLSHLGVSYRQLSGFVVLENLVALFVALVAGGISIGLNQPMGTWKSVGFLGASAGFLGLLVMPVAIRRKLPGNSFDWYRSYCLSMAVVVLFWITASTSFLLYVKTLLDVTALTAWVEIAGVYLFSWGVGFIAVFAPQGVGVFEVVSSSVLRSDIPVTALIALIAGFRLVVLVADTIMWAAFTLLNKTSRSLSPRR